jgi:2-polyprenyl-3-methyl-5-hydroxy-6-metoxy-1,4-benzoquinol methylase
MLTADTPRRTESLSAEEVQRGNQEWWTSNPMSYDWHGEVAHAPFTAPWFDAIDARFLAAAQLDATNREPFDRLIPFDRLRGKRVLEIGCGMGLHTELMTRHGADVTAIDLTPTAVEATTRRLALRGLTARVQQADAERLPFDDRSFDFVWSWGVIHHSSRTARIVRHIARVLTPDGECRVMVYNREGMAARVAFWRDHVLKGKFLRQSFDETLWRFADGFTARHYVREQFEDLFRAFFDEVSSTVCGQEADALPMPRRLRRIARQLVSDDYLRRAQARRGSFLFLTARQPS